MGQRGSLKGNQKIEPNENENATQQKWDTAKRALREKWKALMHSLDKRKSLTSII